MTSTMVAADSCYIPKGNPAKPHGEDAHFFCRTRKWQVIGVADGVGGCAKEGIDAGEYARDLMTNAVNLVNLPGDDVLPPNPKSVLACAAARTKKRGSSTATVISLTGNRLWAANVGDSGFAVIRDSKITFRSPVQQHKFNYPWQLRRRGKTVAAAAEMTMKVRSGDIVVAGTDGLFDNLFPEEMEATVKRCLLCGGKSSPGMVARELAEAARRRSLEQTTVSPFAVAAKEAGIPWLGGKKDDITVVVAYVMENSRRKRKFNFVGFPKRILSSLADLFDVG